MFKSPLYDPYVEMKDDDYSYNYWREDYRKTLLIGIICAYLLEQKIGKRNRAAQAGAQGTRLQILHPRRSVRFRQGIRRPDDAS